MSSGPNASWRGFREAQMQREGDPDHRCSRRPVPFWPVDALWLAERLLFLGQARMSRMDRLWEIERLPGKVLCPTGDHY